MFRVQGLEFRAKQLRVKMFAGVLSLGELRMCGIGLAAQYSPP